MLGLVYVVRPKLSRYSMGLSQPGAFVFSDFSCARIILKQFFSKIF
jgi:hypothetical protein